MPFAISSSSIDEPAIRRDPGPTGKLGYRLLYRLGLTPWDNDRIPPGLAALVEGPHALPPGRALDLGCGTGTHSVYLARHGWQVTGIDFTAQALEAARRKAAENGVSASFIEGDVTRLDGLDLGQGYTLLLDFGCFHGLSDVERDRCVAGLEGVAAPDARMLLFAFQAGRRGPGPRGISREELAWRFAGWTIAREQPVPADKLPWIARRTAPTFYLLQRQAAR